jgi:uncharacterized membrane protein
MKHRGYGETRVVAATKRNIIGGMVAARLDTLHVARGLYRSILALL